MQKLPYGCGILASTVILILVLALACLAAPAGARAQEPTPTATPSLSFQSSASPASGTYVVPPLPFSYSLVISNAGETEAGPLLIQFESADVTPGLFTSTQGTCAWTYGPDYHGFGRGECNLGSLAPVSNATITLNGDTFWNFYSYDAAYAHLAVNGTPIPQGFTYPFGTPTATTVSSGPVGGVVELPQAEGSGSSGTHAPVLAAAAIGVSLLCVAAVWLARRRGPVSK